jgi:hypothetical protein
LFDGFKKILDKDLGSSNPSTGWLSSLSTTMSAKLTFEQRLALLIRPSKSVTRR